MLLGLDDRQLAELQAGAGHRAAAEGARAHQQVVLGQRGDEVLDLLVGHVEDDQLLLRRRPDPARRRTASARSAMRVSSAAADPAGAQREADGVGAVLLLGDADVVALVVLRPAPAAGPSGSARVQVLVLQHLAELLRAPVGHQELDPGVVALTGGSRSRGRSRCTPAQTSVTCVGPDEDADPLGEHRVGRQPAADPEVVAGLAVGVDDADEGDVVDLGFGAVVDAAATSTSSTCAAGC